MTDWRLYFAHDYLCAADLKGRDVPLTISAVKAEDLRVVGGDTETARKVVIYFKETEGRGPGEPKALVTNKTNCRTISELYGNNTEEWKGRRITLYPTTTKAFGKTVDCIRIRDNVPADKKESAA